MTAPIHPIPRELLTGLQNGDDRLFEQGFRELFPILIQETARELDDPSAATRVVEQAFVRVWEGRADIRSADALDVAMRNALHDGVVRARSRRVALHRFERNEGVSHTSPRAASAATAPDMDQAWTRIRRALHPDDQASVAAHAQRGVEAKHRAAAHMSDAVGRGTSWKVPAAILLGIVVVGAAGYGVWRVTRPSRETVIQRSLASSDAQMLTANNGLIGKVTMGDQTIVRLGAGSQLRVSKDFGTSLRAVSLTGTASFAVAPAVLPFELRASGVAISLSTGKVDVRADSLAPTLVRVPDGQARMKVGDSSWTAAAGQSFVVEPNGKIRVPTSLEIDDALGWIDGRFAASGSVKEVVAKVNRWYGANLGIGDASIAARPASAAGSLDSLKATIKSLEKSSKVQMVWTKGRMMLFPAGR
jgi:FecR protein